jgi:hypothetical protein
MTVPETAVHKYHFFPAAKDQIWATGKVLLTGIDNPACAKGAGSSTQ